MSHLDEETAALLALGDIVLDADEAAHLATCDACTEEVRGFRRTVLAGRAGVDAELLTPPDRVWQAIRADVEPAGRQRDSRDAVPRGTRRRRVLVAVSSLVAAAAVVVGVWGAPSWIANRPELVAEARLDGFPDWTDASGEAVLETVDGHSRVSVSLAAAVPDDGYREVWLLAPDGSALVSLGILEGDEGVFPVPDDVDPSVLSVVDISQEAVDGDPTHSGDSIVRGELSRV